MTAKELFLELLKPDAKIDRQLKQYEAIEFVDSNPVSSYLWNGLEPGKTIVNKWGITITFAPGAPGPIPVHSPELTALTDITKMDEQLKVPDIVRDCSTGWEKRAAESERIKKEGKLSGIIMGTGMFEQCHYLMGFEDTLTNLYLHPDEMHKLIDIICEHRIAYAKLLIENMHPDVIMSHDDWGTKDSLFMRRDVWREFYKEPYRRFYDYIRSQGVIVIHHADSYLAPIVSDMAQIGVQVWQGVLPENNIPLLQQELQGKMVLMGGIGAAIDREDATEEEIRAYVRDALEKYCPRGYFIPCITYGGPGTVYKHVDPIIDDEIEKYNNELHIYSYEKIEPVRRETVKETKKEAKKVTLTAEESDILSKVSAALQKGQKNRVLKAVDEALANGLGADVILQQGLVAGMDQLGEDFSNNKVFVPEMLLAARCMSAATEVLKPLLADTNSTTLGKAVLGTVKGDMHDIGKNLVKIMLEGSGIEVIDLGSDVSAEQFVQTAKDEGCELICASALLTTTMAEMARIVELSQQAGIREKVKIMIGGAPVTQQYCDEIGADCYTDDAAAAARMAVKLLTK